MAYEGAYLTRTELSSVMLNKKPAHVTHLTGLLQLFR